MDFIQFLFYVPCFVIPFLIFFTKLHDGYVSVGDIIFCSIIGVIPVVNIIGAIYLLCTTFSKRDWLSTVVF